MAFKATREQLIAQTTDRHLAVTANAGSGKTKTLVDRYVNLLLSGVEVSRIVAITFTRKAASEMHSRVVESIEEMKEKADPSEIAKFRYIRERLTNARITTIHSFCSSLLREFAIEAGISPFFTELPQSDKHAIFDSSFDSLVESWLGDPEKKDILSDLLLSHGRKPFKKIIQTLCKRVEIFQQLEQFYLQNEDSIFQARDREIINFALPIIQEFILHIKEINNELAMAELSKAKSLSLSNLGAVVENDIIKITDLSGNNSLEVLNEFERFIAELRQMKVLKADHTLFQDLSKYLIPRFYDEISALAPKIDKIINLKKTLIYIDKDFELIEKSRFMFGFTKELLSMISEEKGAIPAIDFDDMLVKTSEILENPIVRKKISMDLSYILVDEFQDTNELQYQIIKKLSPALSSLNAFEDSVNVYLVGDEKQSIYGFRYADVRVFLNAKNDISRLNGIKLKNKLIAPDISSNGEPIQTIGAESLGAVTLSTSFRLQPVIAAFINMVFANLMKNDNEFEVAYNPLMASRGSEVLKDPAKSSELINSGELGTVSFIMIKNSDAKNVSEEEAIAMCIRNMISGANKLPVFDRDVIREPRYKDITILARSRKHFKSLTDKFRSYSIPCLIHSGQGFFDTPEVKDLISFVRFLYNSNDDVSFAGFLKSSFIGLNDTMLFKISRISRKGSLFAKLKDGLDSSPERFNQEEREYLGELAGLLNEFTEISGKISLTMLILKLIEDSGWLNKISGLEARKQMKLNVTKFIDYARAFEKRGFRNLYDFVKELDLIAESSLEESEAAIITNDDAVNIMTIHAAKGLEFPIVILMNASDSTQHHSGFEISSEFGLTYKLPMLSEDYSLPFSENTPLHEINQIRKSLSESAEDKRLLYVALTRARDHLIISGAYQQKGPSYFLGMIINSLNITDAEKDRLLNRGGEIAIREKIDVLSEDGDFSALLNFPLRNTEEIETREEIHQDREISINEREYLLDEINSEQSENFFSATSIMLYLNNRDEFIRKYRYGVSEELSDKEFLIGDAGEGDVYGAKAGIIIHKLLENINIWMEDYGTINEGIIKGIVAPYVKSSNEAEKEEVLRRVSEECNKVGSSPLIRRMNNNLRDANFEYKCNLPVGSDFLTAQFDLIIERDADGEQCHEIWDWKSNIVDSEKSMKELCDYYSIQMKVYAYIASLMYPNENPIRTRLLFTRLADGGADDGAWTRELAWTRSELDDFGKELIALFAEMKEALN